MAALTSAEDIPDPKLQGHSEMNAGHFEEISDCWSPDEQPAAYYRTAAARARRLQADVTTPRVKQYLDQMIVHCERLAGNVERPASRPLDRPGCVDQPEGKIRPSARPISNYRVDQRPSASNQTIHLEPTLTTTELSGSAVTANALLEPLN